MAVLSLRALSVQRFAPRGNCERCESSGTNQVSSEYPTGGDVTVGRPRSPRKLLLAGCPRRETETSCVDGRVRLVDQGSARDMHKPGGSHAQYQTGIGS